MATNSSMREAVLIVDRERSIRSLAETVLDYAGYIVLAAETPEQAIEAARANANRISLVLLDPNIIERAELLGHVRPGTRFVLATDYDASMAAFAANMVNVKDQHAARTHRSSSTLGDRRHRGFCHP